MRPASGSAVDLRSPPTPGSQHHLRRSGEGTDVGDSYDSYEKLTQSEKEGEDYEIVAATEGRDSRVVVMAPHGGKIEHGTSEIAKEIAGDAFALYSFEGHKKENNARLHITSHRFDEPRAVALAQEAEIVLGVHGMTGNDEVVMVGGLHEPLVSAVRLSLQCVGIKTREPSDGLGATHSANICNRAKRGGVQLEISRRLRDALVADEQRLTRFAAKVRRLLQRETGDANSLMRTT